jgi:sugar diacid utilization regulator
MKPGGPSYAILSEDSDLNLGEGTIALLLSRLPLVAAQTVQAITLEVPAYRDEFAGPVGVTMASTVELALKGFLRLASGRQPAGVGEALAPVFDGAYNLGRGEARGGRALDALLGAYRVGAREAWRGFSRAALETGLPAREMATFGELVFAYIDGLSAASVAGHADELATTGRVRERYRSLLALSIVSGESPERLLERAQRADWEPPQTLSAVLLPTEQASRALAALDDRTLRSDEELPELDDREQRETTVLLVADADGQRRTAIVRSLAGYSAYLGPSKAWHQARASYLRALRAWRLGLRPAVGVCDTDDHLPALVVAADPAALADLRARVLAPLSELRDSSADRLTETLRAWLLHQGRRDDIAAALHIHPQTVRYRVAQLRDQFGESLQDPDMVAALTVALMLPIEAEHRGQG